MTAGANLDRRAFLGRSTVGLAAAALWELLARDGFADDGRPVGLHHPPRARRVIHIVLVGGLSQVDSFDYKPALDRLHGQSIQSDERPDTFFGRVGLLHRSFWSFRQRGESGLWVSDLFPELATLADELLVVRSMVADTANHTPALFQANSGFRFSGFPAMGSWIAYGLGRQSDELPTFVVIPDARGIPAGGSVNWTSGFLPAEHQGVALRAREPAVHDLFPVEPIPPETEAAARELLSRIDRQHRDRRSPDSFLDARIASYEQAARMQLALPPTLDLSTVSKEAARRYGLDDPACADFGKSCLWARRMVEKGVRYVQLYSGGEFGTPRINWDAHLDVPENHQQEARRVDRPIAGLLQDLRRAGLLDDTLVLCTTEFGRTPFAESEDQTLGKGRDHNPRGFTIWMAGAGLRKGFAHGATDDVGYRAVENPVRWNDLHATVLDLLGLDHQRLAYRHDGIDRRLTDVSGRVLTELLA